MLPSLPILYRKQLLEIQVSQFQHIEVVFIFLLIPTKIRNAVLQDFSSLEFLTIQGIPDGMTIEEDR